MSSFPTPQHSAATNASSRRNQRHKGCRIRLCSDRELFLMAMAICSASMIASYWLYVHHVSATTASFDLDHQRMDASSHHSLSNLFIMSTSNNNGNNLSKRRAKRRRRQQSVVLDLGLPPDEAQVDVSESDSTKNEAKETLEANEESLQSETDHDMASSLLKNEGGDSKETQETYGSSDEAEDQSSLLIWNDRKEIYPISETFPLINVGLPRSGEDTMWNFFSNLGYVTQYGCGDMKKPRIGCLGLGYCIKRNADENRGALEGCSIQTKSAQNGGGRHLEVITQLDSQRYLVKRKPVVTGQILPQIQHLASLYQFAPNATWILPLHLPDHWAFTLTRHHSLRKRLWHEIFVAKHKAHPPIHNRGIFKPELSEVAALAHWEEYYKEHTERIRAFAKTHPSIRLVEVQYRLKRAPQDLIDSLGLTLPMLPKSTSAVSKVSDVWECMRNECDLWDDNLQAVNHYRVTPRPEIKLPKPIFVVGFPKSGTTSVFNFFSCSGAVSQHYCCCGDVSDHRPCYSDIMADCILENKENGRPMLEGCGEYDLYAQIDGERTSILTTDTGFDRRAGHFLPQVFELETIHNEYPNATFILPLRESDEWAKSVGRWFNMRHRLKTEYWLMNKTDQFEATKPLVNIYEKHTQNVIEFVNKHPSHKLIKFHITQPDAGKILSDASGLPEFCWGHHNKNNRPKKH